MYPELSKRFQDKLVKKEAEIQRLRETPDNIHYKALLALAEKYGWSEIMSRPPSSFIAKEIERLQKLADEEKP